MKPKLFPSAAHPTPKPMAVHRHNHALLSNPKPFAATVVSIAAAVTGCGGTGLQLAESIGVVTLDGQPLDRVGVVFHPGVGPVATANTDDQGRFSLRTANQDGAVLGDHVVTITESPAQSMRATEGGLLGAPGSGAPRPASRFDKRYSKSSSSPLRATVERGRENQFAFELNAEGAFQ